MRVLIASLTAAVAFALPAPARADDGVLQAHAVIVQSLDRSSWG